MHLSTFAIHLLLYILKISDSREKIERDLKIHNFFFPEFKRGQPTSEDTRFRPTDPCSIAGKVKRKNIHTKQLDTK
jgi:hypothetical protein